MLQIPHLKIIESGVCIKWERNVGDLILTFILRGR